MSNHMAVGTRVRTTSDVENYPVIFMPAGATGTIAHSDDESTWVTLDRHVPDLAEWDNQLQVWHHESGSAPLEAI